MSADSSAYRCQWAAATARNVQGLTAAAVVVKKVEKRTRKKVEGGEVEVGRGGG